MFVSFFPGAWCAATNNKQQYLQIDFRGMRKVTKVATQGRPGSNDYVETYKLSFSLDGNSFEFHREVRQKLKEKAANTTSSHHMQLVFL